MSAIRTIANRTTARPTTEPAQPANTAAALIPRSTEMYAMQEALAREHMRRREYEARRYARARGKPSPGEARPRARRLLRSHG
jgi:hypothetical protein